MVPGEGMPEEASAPTVDFNDLSQAGNRDETSSAFLVSRQWLAELLSFLDRVLRDGHQVRRLGILIVLLGIAGALIVVPIAVIAYLILGSMAGGFAAGIGTGSAVAITIGVFGGVARRRNK